MMSLMIMRMVMRTMMIILTPTKILPQTNLPFPPLFNVMMSLMIMRMDGDEDDNDLTPPFKFFLLRQVSLSPHFPISKLNRYFALPLATTMVTKDQLNTTIRFWLSP